ncbi:imidazolonepropionase [Prevotella corporis]|uniref:imidazolonepropionase n=1 Tax=Prevotella corporis TaxID=28128 RepID=UPI002365D7E9|nr:imidazolonepropionase [Prevotella corporis]
MKVLVTNIGILAGLGHEGKRCLKGEEMLKLNTIEHAFLYVENGRIVDYGPRVDKPQIGRDVLVVDAEGGAVLPSFCDSHTHVVYAGSREGEFVDKIRGLSYAEIAKRGGGILNSADRLHELSEEELYKQAMQRVDEVIKKGTGAMEIKSGYGLTLEDELKMLRVIRRIKQTAPIKVVANFLGAHAVGRAYTGRQSEYVDHIINDMLPAVAKENLADFIDVFCDEGFFTPDETRRLLQAGAKYGLRGKIHGEELAVSGGVEVAVECNALSVDHLEAMDNRDIELLKNSETIPTALPGTSFFLNMPFAPGRKMIEAGLPLAIASDYNPGSTPSGDMKFAVSLACIKMRLMPAEAINATTLNSACAMGISEDYGSITKGKIANFYITDPIPSIDFIPYAYTTPIIRRIFLKGEEYKG